MTLIDRYKLKLCAMPVIEYGIQQLSLPVFEKFLKFYVFMEGRRIVPAYEYLQKKRYDEVREAIDRVCGN